MKTGHYWALVILVLSLVVGIACTPPPAPPPAAPAENITPPPPPTPPPAPKIIGGGSIQTQGGISFGQQFNVIIMVFNVGDGSAQNVHLYCRANPGGLLLVTPDQPFTPIAPYGVKITLGDMYPGDQKTVNFTMLSPTQAQINGGYGINLEINFTADYYNAQELPIGSITFSVVGQGAPGYPTAVPGYSGYPTAVPGYSGYPTAVPGYPGGQTTTMFAPPTLKGFGGVMMFK